MEPISMDLRERILKALAEEPSSLKVAARFAVSPSFVRKLRIQVRNTGDPRPGHAPGKPRLVGEAEEAAIRELLADVPDATLNELREMVLDEIGIELSETTMWRTLQRMGITYKKNSSGRANGTAKMLWKPGRRSNAG